MAAALLLIFLIPTQVKADPGDNLATNAVIETVGSEAALTAETDALLAVGSEAALTAETDALLARLEEINEMDKSDLTREEKRELRQEVQQIDKTLALNGGGGGVYLSVGALIIIILVLILVL